MQWAALRPNPAQALTRRSMKSRRAKAAGAAAACRGSSKRRHDDCIAGSDTPASEQSARAKRTSKRRRTLGLATPAEPGNTPIPAAAAATMAQHDQKLPKRRSTKKRARTRSKPSSAADNAAPSSPAGLQPSYIIQPGGESSERKQDDSAAVQDGPAGEPGPAAVQELPWAILPQTPPPEARQFSLGDPQQVSLVLAALSGDAGAAAGPTEAAGHGGNSPVSGLVPQGGPHGRQQQFQQLLDVITAMSRDGVGRAVYISGLPGTGKTHTVRAAVAALGAQHGLATPVALSFSCFAVTDGAGVYAALCRQLAAVAGLECSVDANHSPDQAHQRLVGLLQQLARGRGGAGGGAKTPARKAGTSKAHKTPTRGGARALPGGVVLVLDEVDRLVASKAGIDALVRLFSLPHMQGLRCCVVAMANSLDVTERCLPQLKLRGCAPLYLPFGAYQRLQLLAILTAKLAAVPWAVFNPAGLELVARKVANGSGDVRKALQACRTALKLAVEAHAAAAHSADADGDHADGMRSPHGVGAGAGPRPLAPSRRPTLPCPRAAVLGSPGKAREMSAPGGSATPWSAVATALPPSHGATTAPPAAVGMQHVVAALSSLAYQSGASGSTTGAIRSLPQQQQLCLLALASALAAAEMDAVKAAAADAVAAEHGMTACAYRAKYYFGPSTLPSGRGKPFAKLANPFTASGSEGAGSSVGACSSEGAGGSLGGAGSTGGMAGDTARVVPVGPAYQQYRALCASMFQQPASEAEFLSQQQLLSSLGLVAVAKPRGGGPRRSNAAAGAADTTGVLLSLKASMHDIQAGLKDSAVFRAVLARLPESHV